MRRIPYEHRPTWSGAAGVMVTIAWGQAAQAWDPQSKFWDNVSSLSWAFWALVTLAFFCTLVASILGIWPFESEVDPSRGVRISGATYGLPPNQTHIVTEVLRRNLRHGKLKIPATNEFLVNNNDPAVGHAKFLYIQWAYKGLRQTEVAYLEDDTCYLPPRPGWVNLATGKPFELRTE